MLLSILMKVGNTFRVTYQIAGTGNQATNQGADARQDMIFEQDGERRYRNNNGSRVLLGNWINPTSEATGNNYQIRWTGATGDTADGGQTTTQNTWHDMDVSDWFLWVIDSTTGFGGKSITYDVEIGQYDTTVGDQDGIVASGTITVDADREDN